MADDQIVDVEGVGRVAFPADFSQDQILDASKKLVANEVKGQPGYEPQGEISKGFETGLENVKSFLAGSAPAAIGQFVGNPALKKFGLETFEKYRKETLDSRGENPTIESILEDPDKFDAFLNYVQFNAGQAAGTTVPMVLGGLATMALGAKTAVGAIGVGTAIGVGDIYAHQIEDPDIDPEDRDPVVALLGGPLYGALERFGIAGTVSSQIAKLLGQEAAEEVTGSLVKHAAKKIASTAAKEGVTEGAQESLASGLTDIVAKRNPIEEFQKTERLKEIGEEAAAGIVGGGAISTVTTPVEVAFGARPKSDLPPDTPTPDPEGNAPPNQRHEEGSQEAVAKFLAEDEPVGEAKKAEVPEGIDVPLKTKDRRGMFKFGNQEQADLFKVAANRRAKKGKYTGLDANSIINLENTYGADLNDVSDEIFNEASTAFKAGKDGIPGYTPLASRTKPTTAFKSNLYEAAKSLKQEKGGGDQFIATLKKMPGIRQEELDFVGVEPEFKGRKNVTKQEIVEFIRDNQIGLSEIILSENKTEDRMAFDTARESIERMFIERGFSLAEAHSFMAQAQGQLNSDQLKSFINLNFPYEDTTDFRASIDVLKDSNTKTNWNEYTLPGSRSNYEEVLLVHEPKNGVRHNESHFQGVTDNVLSHVRADTRQTFDDRKPAYFINELQSDIHQRLRQSKDGPFKDNVWRFKDKIPFKKNWPELTFKRALRRASETGHGYIAWPTGKQVDDIQRYENEFPSNEQLRVKQFYDKDLTKIATKIGKRYGVAPKKIVIEQVRGRTDTAVTEVMALEITPEMNRDLLMGQPLYSMKMAQTLEAGQTVDDFKEQLVRTIVQILGPRKANLKFIENIAGHYGLPTKDGSGFRGITFRDVIALDPTRSRTETYFTAVHEAVHLLHMLGMFNQSEDKFLMSPEVQNRLKSLIRQAHTDGHPTISNSAALEEIALDDPRRSPAETLAYGMEAVLWYDAIKKPIPGQKLPSLLTRLKNAIKTLIHKINNMVRGYGFQSADDFMRRVYKGEMSKRLPGTGPFRFVIEQEWQDRLNHIAKETRHSTEELKRFTDDTILRDPDSTSPRVLFREPVGSVGVEDLGLAFKRNPSGFNNGRYVAPAVVKMSNPAWINIDHTQNAGAALAALSATPSNMEPNPDAVFTFAEGQALAKRMQSKPEQRNRNKILRDALKAKGYDGALWKDDTISTFSADQNWDLMHVEDVSVPKEFLGSKIGGKFPHVPHWRDWKDSYNAAGLSWSRKFFTSTRHIASKYPDIARVYLIEQAMKQHRSVLQDEAARDIKTNEDRIAALARLAPESQENVFKALELVRLLGRDRMDKNAAGQYEITHPKGINLRGVGSKQGETVTLSAEESAAVDKASTGFNILIDDLRESYLTNLGWPKHTTVKQVKDTITHLEQKLERLENAGDRKNARKARKLIEETTLLKENLEALDGWKDSHWIPFIRFGTTGITVKDKKTKKTLHFQTIRSKGLNRTVWYPRWKELQRQLKADYPDGVVDARPWELTYDNVKRMAEEDLLNFDTLASLLTEDNAQAYGEMRDEIVNIIKRKGFKAHMTRAKGIPGYSRDLPKVMGQYIIAASNFSSKVRYGKELSTTVNNIGNETSKRRVKKYAEDYTNYLASPVEEFSFIRSLGFAYYLGMNYSSAVLQLFTIPSFTAPNMMKVAGPASVSAGLTKNFTKAMNNSLQSFRKYATEGVKFPDMYVALNPALLDIKPAHKATLMEFWEKGILKPQRTLEQSGMEQSELNLIASKSLGNTWRKTVDIAASMFNTFESIGRMTTLMTILELADSDPNFMKKVNVALRRDEIWQAMVARGEATVEGYAIFIIDQTFGVYGKNNRAEFMRGIGAPVFQFSSYPLQMAEMLSRELNASFSPARLKELKRMKKRTPAQDTELKELTQNRNASRKVFALMFGGLMLFGGWQGAPGAEDLKEIFEHAWNHLAGRGDLDIDTEIREAIYDITNSSVAAEFASRGIFRVAGSLAGEPNLNIDIARRVALGNIPAFDILKVAMGAGGNVSDALGVPGSIFIGQALDHINRDKLYSTPDSLIESFAPTSIKNVYQALKWNAEGVRTASGELVAKPEDISNFETIAKALGFSPGQVANQRELIRAEKRADTAARSKQSTFNRRLAMEMAHIINANRSGNKELVQEHRDNLRAIRQEITEYNAGRPRHQMVKPDTDYLRRLARKMVLGEDVMHKFVGKKARRRVKELREIYDLTPD